MYEPLTMKAQKMITKDEKEDLIRRVQKLNDDRFKHELFNYTCFDDEKLNYLKLVFLLRGFAYIKDEKLFKSTDKERVKNYKCNQRASVSRYDVCLLSFFKRLGVI